MPTVAVEIARLGSEVSRLLPVLGLQFSCHLGNGFISFVTVSLAANMHNCEDQLESTLKGLRQECQAAPTYGVNGRALILQAARLIAEREAADHVPNAQGQSVDGSSWPVVPHNCLDVQQLSIATNACTTHFVALD